LNLHLSAAARRDLEEVYAFIAADNDSAAERVVRRLLGVMEQLATGELNGPEVRLENGRLVRRWSVPPYRVYYRRTSLRTTIVRIYHQARRPL
jgi:toxin ParE1/3/4